MIKITNLSYTYPSKHQALSLIDLQINKGEFVSIIGPSGCGKTTLLKIMANLIEDYSGEVKINNLTPEEYRKKGKLSYLFQQSNLFPWRTVWQNINLPLEIHHDYCRKKTDQALSLVGLTRFRNFYPANISGGMQQRTALARGLVTDPEVIFMDEPFASLDEITREKLEEELLTLWRIKGVTIVFVTHNIQEAVFLSDRVAIMSLDGRIKKKIKVNLKKPRAKKIRSTTDFFNYCNTLRSLLENGK